MRIKSYYSTSVEAAMERARKELGEEAMILESRPAPPEARHLGAHEVVFGVQETGSAAPPPPPASPPAASRDLDAMRRTVDSLRREMEDWSHLWRLRLDPAMPESEAEARLMTLLIDRDLPLPLAARAARNAGRANAARKGAAPDEVRRLRQELAAFAPCDASLPRIAVLAGPAGAGKTTALVKLAAMLSLDGRRSIQLISADPYRIAAAEQLRAYAGILGAPFASAATPAELHQALRDAQAKDLTLVDLAGFSPSQMELAAPWASYCATTPAPLEVHLVLPATLRSADLEPVWSRFAAFAPAKLLFTRLDEAPRAGILLAASCRAELPLSFLSTGPGIPEDFEPASTDAVISRFLAMTPAAEIETTPPEPKPDKPGWRRFDWPEATQTAKSRGAFAHA